MSSDASVFTLRISVPRHVRVSVGAGRELDRDAFFEWLWGELAPGLVGVHEGTLLSEEAAERGLETDSWTVDAGEAPAHRDWIASQKDLEAELYFGSLEDGRAAVAFLTENVGGSHGVKILSDVAEQKPRDWDAEWKASFLNNGEGVPIAPFWRVVPPWKDKRGAPGDERWLKINPGAGFGTGTHETTQLCLEALGQEARARGPRMLVGARVLDFGSGSGILAIGAALLGAQVDAVEVDRLAIENAVENAEINGVEASLTHSTELSADFQPYEIVLANILKPILLQFSEELCRRIAPKGVLILSGLIEGDVAAVSAEYSRLLGVQPDLRRLNEWRALVFKRA